MALTGQTPSAPVQVVAHHSLTATIRNEHVQCCTSLGQCSGLQFTKYRNGLAGKDSHRRNKTQKSKDPTEEYEYRYTKTTSGWSSAN